MKRKKENKFVKYSDSELKQQIRNTIQPTCNVVENLDKLILNIVKQPLEKLSEPIQHIPDCHPSITLGTVGWWQGPLGQNMVGIILDESTIQLYSNTRYGYIPDDVPQDVSKWALCREIEAYDYVERKSNVYLVIG